MAIDLTSVKGQIADLKRDLFYAEIEIDTFNNVLNFYRYPELLGSIDSGWYMPPYPEVDVSGQPFYLLSISDDEETRTAPVEFSKLVKYGIQVGILGEMYEVLNVDVPKGATKVYYFKIQPTGEKEPV